jgi:hypothetical protein
MEKLNKQQISDLACKYGLSYASLKAVVDVESGGIGFATDTGKIIIQFEPKWMQRKAPYTPSGLWSQNGVERQSKEWLAFNDAFAKNANAAMESTSIGFKTVGAMWDFAKESEANQLELGLKFIKSNPKMYNGLKSNDFKTFAYYYNGSQYEKFNYANRMQSSYNKALQA